MPIHKVFSGYETSYQIISAVAVPPYTFKIVLVTLAHRLFPQSYAKSGLNIVKHKGYILLHNNLDNTVMIIVKNAFMYYTFNTLNIYFSKSMF